MSAVELVLGEKPVEDQGRDDLGGRLRMMRGANSQKTWAAILGVALSSYQLYERGDRVPRADLIEKMARSGWSPLWLLTGEGPMRRAQSETPAHGPWSAMRLCASPLDGGEAAQLLHRLRELNAFLGAPGDWGYRTQLGQFTLLSLDLENRVWKASALGGQA